MSDTPQMGRCGEGSDEHITRTGRTGSVGGRGGPWQLSDGLRKVERGPRPAREWPCGRAAYLPCFWLLDMCYLMKPETLWKSASQKGKLKPRQRRNLLKVT